MRVWVVLASLLVVVLPLVLLNSYIVVLPPPPPPPPPLLLLLPLPLLLLLPLASGCCPAALLRVPSCWHQAHLCGCCRCTLTHTLFISLLHRRGVEEEVRQVVSKSRLFQFKPDGEVTFRFAQDGNGMPAPTMQVRLKRAMLVYRAVRLAGLLA